MLIIYDCINYPWHIKQRTFVDCGVNLEYHSFSKPAEAEKEHPDFGVPVLEGKISKPLKNSKDTTSQSIIMSYLSYYKQQSQLNSLIINMFIKYLLVLTVIYLSPYLYQHTKNQLYVQHNLPIIQDIKSNLEFFAAISKNETRIPGKTHHVFDKAWILLRSDLHIPGYRCQYSCCLHHVLFWVMVSWAFRIQDWFREWTRVHVYHERMFYIAGCFVPWTKCYSTTINQRLQIHSNSSQLPEEIICR